ncbi:Tetrahydromethanopterin S-methyltransferase subunit A 1 [uncultured archaeon]|nr:Tetrahydromethanopterin S-methyltransferase subunit A 1 [uncultured archaeon]
MNVIEEIAGEICKILLPIEDKLYYGNPNSTLAICTLSSMKLLKEIANSSLIDKINIAGRLLSENKGINLLVRHLISNKKIRTIILCGEDTAGHRPGHSILCLYQNGINQNGAIIGSGSPNPILTLSAEEVMRFQKQVKIINEIGETEISNLKQKINAEST